MIGSLLVSGADELQAVWRDYWSSVWHQPLPWDDERLRCFLQASEGRAHVNPNTGDGMVSDFPRGRRPFLGVLTNSGTQRAAADSGVLEYNDDGHLLTIAPTRAGKGAAQIVPNLLLYAGSCLVIDIKGENYAVTAKHRAEQFENARVLKFAPFDDDTARYNPLDFIRVEPDGRPTSFTFDDTRLVADMLMPTHAREEFWDIEARGLLTMLLFHVATCYSPTDPARTMASVTELLFPQPLADGGSAFGRTVDAIRREADFSDNTILGALVTAFVEHEDKVRAGILSTCRSGMAIWLSERLQRATAKSDFQFSDLKRSLCRPWDQVPAPTTLYLVIPPEYLREYRPVLRMIVGLAAVELTRPNAWAALEAEGWYPRPPCPVLFLLDEFPALGHIAPIEQGVAYLAGYGVQIWTFVQSIGQLKEIYKENWTTFISNAGATSYFGITDPELAEQLSRQLGDTDEYALEYQTSSLTDGTSSASSQSDSHGYSSNFSSLSGTTSSSSRGTSSSDTDSQSKTVQDHVRFKREPVARAADVRALPPNLQLILLRNKRPVLATLLPYYASDLFGKLYGTWGR